MPQLLSPSYGAHLISLDRIGGVGKTALVLETAYRCWPASTGELPDVHVPTFDAIIFTTAKQQHLTPHGILARNRLASTLRDIFREIARTLDRPEITHSAAEDQPARVRNALSRQRTLLIVDNMETIEEQHDVLTFLYDLPPDIKVLITTRERLFIPPIRLQQLSESEGLHLIDHEAQEKAVSLNDEQALTLYQRVGGVPAAIIYAIGRMAGGYSVEGVLRQLANHNGDIARFCFEGAVAPLRGQPAHHLLMATAIFPKRPLRDALLHTAGLHTDPITADEGLRELKQLSLISQRDGRIGMLPLTREYALAELAACPEFEREARERWVGWYLEFAQKYGGDEWQEWHIHYDRVDEEWQNVMSVLNWGATHEKYNKVINLWDNVQRVAHIYGYWDDRLTWLEWKIEESERRGEWNNAIYALYTKAFALTLMGRSRQLKEADILLKRAWKLYSAVDYRELAQVAEFIAILRLRQKQYNEAQYWLDQNEALLKKAKLEPQEYIRLSASTPYYRAETLYRKQEFDQAEGLYGDALEMAESIGWQRVVLYTQNWLANVAIAKNNLDEAEHLLRTGLPVVERNKDQRRIACYKRSFAHLEQKRGNLDEARRWAKEALDGFERLGMYPEMEQMRALLGQL